MPAKDDASRLEALFGTELAAATLPNTPWAALLPGGDRSCKGGRSGDGGGDGRLCRVLGQLCSRGERSHRIRPERGIRSRISESLARHREPHQSSVAVRRHPPAVDIHRQFCEAVAFFTLCRRNPTALNTIDHVVDRLLDLCPPPRSESIVLVGEIAMLRAMVPEDPDPDHVLEMLGFPPVPTGPAPAVELASLAGPGLRSAAFPPEHAPELLDGRQVPSTWGDCGAWRLLNSRTI